MVSRNNREVKSDGMRLTKGTTWTPLAVEQMARAIAASTPKDPIPVPAHPLSGILLLCLKTNKTRNPPLGGS